MPSILTTATINCKDTPAREKVIAAFQKIIQYSKANEPEVLQYVCCVPFSDSANRQIYMIEEYANQAASDAHLTAQPVQDLIQLFTTGDVLAEPPAVHHSTVLAKKTIAPAMSAQSDPGIVILEFPPSEPGQSFRSPEELEGIAEKVRSRVKGFLSLTVAQDKETKGLRMECVVESSEALMSFYSSVLADEGIQMVNTKILSKHGFLSREGKSRL